jgi:hypothetical protein
MNALVLDLAVLHQQDLLHEAELYRRANLGKAAEPSVPAWRRGLGRIVSSAARSIFPSIEVERSSSLASARGASPQPAC